MTLDDKKREMLRAREFIRDALEMLNEAEGSTTPEGFQAHIIRGAHLLGVAYERLTALRNKREV